LNLNFGSSNVTAAYNIDVSSGSAVTLDSNVTSAANGTWEVESWISALFWDVAISLDSSNVSNSHWATGPYATATGFAYLELSTDSSSTATLDEVSIDKFDWVAACGSQTGSNTGLPANEGCQCNAESAPILLNDAADFSAATCVAECAAGK